MRFNSVSKILSTIFVLGTVSNAAALPLTDAATVRPSFTVGGQSFDGNGSDSINAFDNFTSSDFLRFGTVTDNTASGTRYDIFFLAEVAFYDGNQLPGSANKFGKLTNGGAGTFQTTLDSNTKNPGTGVAVSFTSNPGEQFDLAILSPEGKLFSADDNLNTNSAPHILGKVVTTAGTVTLQSVFTLNQMLSFNLLVGDLVLFFDDQSDNANTIADLDYNDMVLVIRQTTTATVPEPTSMLLLFSGLGAAAIRRRKNAAK